MNYRHRHCICPPMIIDICSLSVGQSPRHIVFDQASFFGTIMSVKMKINWLVTGYLKQEFLQVNEKYQYPESLTLLFIQFLGNVLFGFDIINEKYKDFICDDGQILEIDNSVCPLKTTITVGCSYPFESGVYTVIVKYYKRVYSPIGIISDETICNKEMWIFDDKTLYNYAIYPNNLCQTSACREYGSNGSQSNVCDYWNKNNEAKLIIDCNEWTLTYFVNDKQAGIPVNIAKDTKYYMAISLNSHHDSKYEILYFEHQS